MEKALTVGGSLTQTFSLAGRDNDAELRLFPYAILQLGGRRSEYDPEAIVFLQHRRRSFTDTYQIDFSWTPVERLDIFVRSAIRTAK